MFPSPSFFPHPDFRDIHDAARPSRRERSVFRGTVGFSLPHPPSGSLPAVKKFLALFGLLLHRAMTRSGGAILLILHRGNAERPRRAGQECSESAAAAVFPGFRTGRSSVSESAHIRIGNSKSSIRRADLSLPPMVEATTSGYLTAEARRPAGRTGRPFFRKGGRHLRVTKTGIGRNA